jgi:hypothetical protein
MQIKTSTPGKSGALVDPDKYERIKAAILQILPAAPDGMTWVELVERIAPILPESIFRHMGTIRWYAKAVQLDMEARGEIIRVPDSRPTRIKMAA